MKLTAEQEQIKTLLSETITLLCKNDLKCKNMFGIEALIGITLDDEEVILMSIKESVRNANGNCDIDGESDDYTDALNNGHSSTSDADCNVSDLALSNKRFHDKISTARNGSTSSSVGLDVNPKTSCDSNSSTTVKNNNAKDTSYEEDNKTSRSDKYSISKRYRSLRDSVDNNSSIIILENDADNTPQLKKWKHCNFVQDKTTHHLNDISAISDDQLDLKSIVDIKKEEPESCDLYNIEHNAGNNRRDEFSKQECYTEYEGTEDMEFNEASVDNFTDTSLSEFMNDSKVPFLSPLMHPESRNWCSTDGRKDRHLSQGATSTLSSPEYNNIILRCRYCSEVFPTMTEYLRHIGTHRTAQDFYKYPCPCCEKSFSSHTNFRGHMSKHTSVKEFVCPYCGRGYAFKQMLKDHINQHLGIVK